MTLTDQQIQLMQEQMTSELVQMLMERWGYDMPKALDVVYNSDTFARLEDKNSGLYYQSVGYVYSFLNNELTTGIAV